MRRSTRKTFDPTRHGGVHRAAPHRHRPLVVVAALVFLAAPVVACGGDGDSAGDADDATTETTVTTETTADPTGAETDTGFDPAAGDTGDTDDTEDADTDATVTDDTGDPGGDDGTADQPIPPPIIDEPTTPDGVRSITIGGMGAEYGPPTRAVVDLGVNVRRPTVREATDGAVAVGGALVAALIDNGVPESEIQMSQFGINPTHDQFDYNRIVGYEVTLGYRVTVADVGSLGSVLAAGVAAGGDDVRAWGIRFEGDPAPYMEAARAAAWEDLRIRAESTATHAGESLGELLDVHEKVLITTPQGMMQGGEGDSATFDIPVSPGQVGVVVLLTATYALGTGSTVG